MSTNRTSSNPRYAIPRSAYIHVPFCRHRCGYCNFTLIAGRDELIERYLSAVGQEISKLDRPYELDTLYFGGGTPSHLPNSAVAALNEKIRQRFRLAETYEWTVEANPLDLTPEKIASLKDIGVNRLSIGVQSFEARWLELLERDHRFPDAFQAIQDAKQSFPAVSLDLIFGLPGQTLDDWRFDLERAIELETQHVSVYGLTFERGTSFWSRLLRAELERCPEEEERAMYELAIEMLTRNGFEHYEVSNFARPGFRCRHNEAYWLGHTYLAAGPGAARHVEGRREMNHRSTTTYLSRVLAGISPVAELEELSAEDSARERFVFGLRRLQGVEFTAFETETGYSVEELFERPLNEFLSAGLLQQSGSVIRLTPTGLLVSDALWPRLLAPS